MVPSNSSYRILPALDGASWGDLDWVEWGGANPISIQQFRPESSDHRPEVRACLLYDQRGVYGRFEVNDQYVVCRQTQLHDPVCQDSCVEFFVQALATSYYINFEWNAHGVLHASKVYDPDRSNGGLKDCQLLENKTCEQVCVVTDLDPSIREEVADPISWRLAFHIPYELFEVSPPASGEAWRANFYKCADKSSHPHWASWAPVPELNFHEPSAFGSIIFA